MEQVSIDRLTRFYYYKFKEGYNFEGHTHSAWEINLIIAGKMSVTYGGDVMTLSEGDFFVGEPWGFHCNRAVGKDAEMAVIHFEDTDAPLGTSKGYSVRSLTQDEFSVARLMLAELLRRRYDDGALSDYTREEYTNAKKLCEVLVSRVMGASKIELENSSPKVRLYRQTVEFMEKHIGEKLTIDMISKNLHISPAFLKGIFLEFTGGGVMSYFTQMKIRLAKKMLERGKSVSIVSDTLGFSSQCYFSTVFGKVVGDTPKNYQKCHSRKE